ncbi:MAG: hypothetical protein QOJ24_1441, partial [Mycobacterium sp.]|nr:hypothetical protein [Mycobacterium sp.]
MIIDPQTDVVIVGGGHNALVAAGYLARAGRRVRILEKLDHVGGAAVSAHAFEGIDARLSRYSYLVSLLPKRIIDDLGVRVRLARRRYSSYTPDPATGGETGLLIGPNPTFAAVGAQSDAGPFAEFYQRARVVTSRLWLTMTSPLLTRDDAFKLVLSGGDPDAEETWQALIDRPIGHAITETVSNDLVRGVMATDALIGTFARLDDPSLEQNICFLYHLLGGGTGDWDVPIGGMGAVSGALAAAAAGFGAEITTTAEVYAIDPDGEVRYELDGEQHRVAADHILAGVTPTVLAELIGDPRPTSAPGAQVKVNLLLRRLPRLRDETVTAEQAFGGTFHINENYSQLDAAYDRAAGGSIPDPLPCEIYCHSLTDPTILSD